MRTKIYQINPKRDTENFQFVNYENVQKFRQTSGVDESVYDEVFSAEIDETDLEQIFIKFNTDTHPLYRGHSLSVSDIVVNENGAFFCDSEGFTKIEFDESKTQKPENLMQVVYVEPGKKPYVAEIPSTLDAEQKAVKGYIEAITLDDGCCLICNEEAKLIGMQGNRRIADGQSIIAGPFFVCGSSEEDFIGLTKEEVVKYMDRFSEPEDISDNEVMSDTKIMIIGM